MTYNEFINNIILKRGQWSDDVRFSERGCARHHIVPRCLGGAPRNLNWQKHKNIIWLYPAEHFLAHKLLALENSTNELLVCAYKRMCYSHKLKKYIVLPSDYELAERLFAHTHSNYLKGKKHKVHIIHNKVEYSKQKSLQCSGSGNPMYKKGYKISGGKNGRAIRIYQYKENIFYCRKELAEFLQLIDCKISKSTISKFEKGSVRVVREHPILIDLSWRYKNENKND